MHRKRTGENIEPRYSDISCCFKVQKNKQGSIYVFVSILLYAPGIFFKETSFLLLEMGN